MVIVSTAVITAFNRAKNYCVNLTFWMHIHLLLLQLLQFGGYWYNKQWHCSSVWVGDVIINTMTQ